MPEESKNGVERQTAKAGFPRSARLLRHADFERVYKLGRRHFSPSMTVFYLPRAVAGGTGATAPGLRVGFTVGRALGGAVQRNRIKRRLREAVRLIGPPLVLEADVVINPKKTLLKADFEAIVNELRKSFVVIEQKANAQASSEGNADKKKSGGVAEGERQ